MEQITKNELTKEELLEVVGGTSVSLTGSLLEAMGNLFQSFFNFGKGFGSTLRRIFDAFF